VERAVRDTLQRLNKGQAIMDVRTLDQIKATSVASGRLQTFVMSSFGGIALLLAALGLYGVLAYSVALRVREIGIRAALGASSSRLVRTVLAEGLGLTLLGLAIGVTAAIALTPLIGSVLYRVDAHDPYLMSGAVAVLVLVSTLACAVPAWRAARIDPIDALRSE
jgi:ABC-type antimicrobial peptide transport system permease subunit